MSVTAEQQRLLLAMGIEPLLLAGTAPLPAAADGNSAAAASASGWSALEAALRRAAGGADIATLQLDLRQLHQQPQLKRALWPRLRNARRGAQ